MEDPIASVIDAEQVGADVAREMLETYYWTRVFKFSQYESAVLGAFLTTDKFGLNLYPAEYARHLHLTLQPPKYVATAPVKGPSDFNKCLATVEALTAVHAARLQVVFDMDLTDCVEDETDRAMPLLIVENMVKNLNARGLRAKIAYRNCWEE